jgi:predicted Zn-dependent protease
LRWCRARALAGAGRPADAAQEYQALLASLGDDAMPELRLTLAWTLLEAGQSTAAARQLDALPPAFVSDPQLAPELSRLRRAIAAGRPRP